jgi:peptidase M50B-like protein
MRWLLVAGAALLVATRYPALVEYVGLAGLVLWIVVCCSNNRAPSRARRASAPLGRSEASCRFCGYSSTVVRVAHHEAGHWVVGEAFGLTPTSAEIARDGSGVTYIRGDRTDYQQAVIAAAGSKAEELRCNLFFEQDINGWKSEPSSDKHKWLRHSELAGIDPRRACSDALRILRANSGRQQEIADRLMRDMQIGNHS